MIWIVFLYFPNGHKNLIYYLSVVQTLIKGLPSELKSLELEETTDFDHFIGVEFEGQSHLKIVQSAPGGTWTRTIEKGSYASRSLFLASSFFLILLIYFLRSLGGFVLVVVFSCWNHVVFTISITDFFFFNFF